jgi:1,2-phenylacetyl-CoA epoxidase PaaB subunit
MKKENEVERIMDSLEVSRKEAEEIWAADNSDEMAEEQAELDAKAKENIKNYTQSEKTYNKGKKKERKVDEVKLQILQQVQAVLGGEIEKEISLHFEVDGVKYSFNLVKHRN